MFPLCYIYYYDTTKNKSGEYNGCYCFTERNDFKSWMVIFFYSYFFQTTSKIYSNWYLITQGEVRWIYFYWRTRCWWNCVSLWRPVHLRNLSATWGFWQFKSFVISGIDRNRCCYTCSTNWNDHKWFLFWVCIKRWV